ncbi:hypothetical protein JYG23_13130 [Sedimentibacter sp. zth1]|nr:hypothetical protein [Sedimentibacter sp. zth1]QSX05601.1 hypothetical protein JYG23_13130 [Sedimentibacter sp. zth1]
MIIKSNDIECNEVENFLGGKGKVSKKVFLREARLHGNGRTFVIYSSCT